MVRPALLPDCLGGKGSTSCAWAVPIPPPAIAAPAERAMLSSPRFFSFFMVCLLHLFLTVRSQMTGIQHLSLAGNELHPPDSLPRLLPQVRNDPFHFRQGMCVESLQPPAEVVQ